MVCYNCVSILIGPINREMRHLISSLQNHNHQLKGEVLRYKRKLREAQSDLSKVSKREMLELKRKCFHFTKWSSFVAVALCSALWKVTAVTEGAGKRGSGNTREGAGHKVDFLLRAQWFVFSCVFFLAIRSVLAVVVLSYSPSPALKTQRRNLQRSNRSLMIRLPKCLSPRLLLKMLVK